ncbi:amidophosphoribosyltransferase [Psychrobacter sp. FDAARGOS_221]|nr:amidophosphoribosyltransferase [Psychrobacter sp. FDAARGOS_221]
MYQLGMWRVQYLQKVCCVCRIYPVATISFAKKGAQLEHPFFSYLVCHACHQDLDWLPATYELSLSLLKPEQQAQSVSVFDALTIQSAAPHVNYLRTAIINFKYKEQLSALPILVHALRQLPRPQGCHGGNSVILATPTTEHRLAVRGFEPVAVLAHYLSQHWQIPLWHGVVRIDDAGSQQGLDRHQRQSNMSQAFQVIEKPPCRNLLLFDDVVTTGATLSALALTLLNQYPKTKILAYSLSHGH